MKNCHICHFIVLWWQFQPSQQFRSFGFSFSKKKNPKNDKHFISDWNHLCSVDILLPISLIRFCHFPSFLMKRHKPPCSGYWLIRMSFIRKIKRKMKLSLGNWIDGFSSFARSLFDSFSFSYKIAMISINCFLFWHNDKNNNNLFQHSQQRIILSIRSLSFIDIGLMGKFALCSDTQKKRQMQFQIYITCIIRFIQMIFFLSLSFFAPLFWRSDKFISEKSAWFATFLSGKFAWNRFIGNHFKFQKLQKFVCFCVDDSITKISTVK